jgi:Reverse transcriptase (RNA-dependent DNA polymerase)
MLNKMFTYLLTYLGSNVLIASLDASKAFDRVNHFKLFSVLLTRGLPLGLVDLITNWYLKLSVVVRWNGFNSGALRISRGVRQGGVLLPSLFNIYVDSVNCRLCKTSLGCHFRSCYIGCIMYADDIQFFIAFGLIN